MSKEQNITLTICLPETPSLNTLSLLKPCGFTPSPTVRLGTSELKQCLLLSPSLTATISLHQWPGKMAAGRSKGGSWSGGSTRMADAERNCWLPLIYTCLKGSTPYSVGNIGMDFFFFFFKLTVTVLAREPCRKKTILVLRTIFLQTVVLTRQTWIICFSQLSAKEIAQIYFILAVKSLKVS